MPRRSEGDRITPFHDCTRGLGLSENLGHLTYTVVRRGGRFEILLDKVALYHLRVIGSAVAPLRVSALTLLPDR
jgi:hypothetical protein